MAKLKTIWINKNPDDKAEIENALLNSTAIIRLKEIVQERLAELSNKEVSLESYKDQSWSHMQAHANGRRSELLFLMKLLDLGE